MESPSVLLILPAGYGDGPAYRSRRQAEGLAIVGASSLEDDPERSRYAEWIRLPHVAEPGFDQALTDAIARYGITDIHATHHVVWSRLAARLPKIAPEVQLTRGRSNLDVEAEYRALRERTMETPAIAELAQASAPRTPLTSCERAGFLRAAMSIPGESYEAKLLAMMEVALRAPVGDIVEIGSLFGRTAALLAMLARRCELGAVLCVDPWSAQEIDQDAELLREASLGYDWRAWRLIFEVNVAPFAVGGRLNYVHGTSAAGAVAYAAGAGIETETFGRTAYEGRIGLLHIDANHEYEHVRQDAALWTPKMKPGGWIIFDDYEWAWGDGPKRVADDFLKAEAARVRTHFVVGGALFLQLKA